MAELKEEIGHRLELLHRRINELIEQQKATERQIKAYKDLVRHYHAVYEAEHGLGTEGQLEPELIEKLEQIINEAEPAKETKGYKSVSDAVLEVLSERTDALHASQIAKAITERYPAIQERVKDIEKRVVVALVRGVQQELYERVGRNVYKLKTKGK
jgi:hypothetical protein